MGRPGIRQAGKTSVALSLPEKLLVRVYHIMLLKVNLHARYEIL